VTDGELWPETIPDRRIFGALEPVPWGIPYVLLAVFLVVALFVLILLSVAVIAHAAGISSHSAPELAAELGATLIFEICMFVVALGLALPRRGMSLRRYGYRSFPLSESYLPLIGVIGTYAILAVYIGLISALHQPRFTPTPNLPEGIFKARSLIPLAAVEACLVAPIVEESFFRGFIFRGLLGHTLHLGGGDHSLRLRIGFWAAAALSGLLFAVFHGELGLLVPFTGVGILFAWIFRRTGSLWPNILAHAGFNAVSLALAVATQH
jgi:membrane protease YdiL (CAAX protease family)